MVRSDGPDGARTHLKAFVSDDEGVSWKGGLLLDERESSYPDGALATDGSIYVIYDHQRYTLNREGKRGVGAVMMAKFREEDARAGKLVGDSGRLKIEISRLR
jgi:sialidase-1